MRKLIKNIVYLIGGMALVYSLIAIPLSNHLTGKYDVEANGKRPEYGLRTIDAGWKRDSITFQGYGNYSINELKEISSLRLRLEDDRFYCEYWSPEEPQPFSYYKTICYFKSFWFWKNRQALEIDQYQKNLEVPEYATIRIGVNFIDNAPFSRLDTSINRLQMDSILKAGRDSGLEYCGTGVLDLMDYEGLENGDISLNKALATLKQWHTDTIIQETVVGEAAPAVSICEVAFKSPQQQADSLQAYLKRALESDSISRLKWERKFFCAFPGSFKEMEALFGHDNKSGAAPMYDSWRTKQVPHEDGLMSDHIAFFNQLQSIPKEEFYNKYIRINIGGRWEADLIREAFGFHYSLLEDTEAATTALLKFSDEEIKSVFLFIFDGPHPEHEGNRVLYNMLKKKLDTHSSRLSNLLTQSFEKLMAEDHDHH